MAEVCGRDLDLASGKSLEESLFNYKQRNSGLKIEGLSACLPHRIQVCLLVEAGKKTLK